MTTKEHFDQEKVALKWYFYSVYVLRRLLIFQPNVVLEGLNRKSAGFVKRFSMIEGKYVMRFVRNVLCCRIRLSNASVYSLFRSKLSLHKGQILILQAGFVHGESRENIFY